MRQKKKRKFVIDNRLYSTKQKILVDLYVLYMVYLISEIKVYGKKSKKSFETN